MKTFGIICMTLVDFCDHVGWDYFDTLDCLNHSDQVSWGNNDDTLVLPKTLADICERELPTHILPEKLYISLGS
jgi:hypothetical protein